MRKTLLDLYELSQIDARVLEIQKTSEDLPKQIAELESVVEEIRLELGTHRAEYDAKKAEQQQADATSREEGAKHQKWKRRLNDIRSPREYQALSREVEMTERHIRSLDEQIFAIEEELEAKQTVIKELEEKLAGEESIAGDKIGSLRAEQRRLDEEAREAAKDRPQVEGRLPARIGKLYERIRKRRGVAVAITDGKCYGCNFVVRPQMMVEIRRLDTMEQCPQCSRILVPKSLVEAPAAEGEAAAAEAR